MEEELAEDRNRDALFGRIPLCDDISVIGYIPKMHRDCVPEETGLAKIMMGGTFVPRFGRSV